MTLSDRKPIDAMSNEELRTELGKLDVMIYQIEQRREAILDEL